MKKAKTNSIPQQFWWMLSGLLLVDIGVFSVPSVINMISRTSHYAYPFGTVVVFLSLQLIPFVVSCVAYLVARRFHIAERLGWALLLGQCWSIVWSTWMQVVTPALQMKLYDSYSFAGVIVATITIGAVMVMDRWWHPTGLLRRWRIFGAIVIFMVSLIAPMMQALVRDAASAWSGVLVSGIIVGLVGVMTVWIFRHLPWVEQAKRLMLLVVVAAAGGALCVGGLSTWGGSLRDGLVLVYLPLTVAVAMYVFGVVLLKRPLDRV